MAKIQGGVNYLEGKSITHIIKHFFSNWIQNPWNFNSEKEGNEESSTDLDSVRPIREKFRWDKGIIPYDISGEFSYNFHSKIKNAIADINANLEGCIKFRLVQSSFSRIFTYS